MAKTHRIITAWMVVLLGAAGLARAAITIEGLLNQMTDLSTMAEFPDPAYTCKQFSSYDPASKSPSENWFANADAGHYIRVEERGGRKEHVMMDAKGPGAIVRIWSANPNGVMRVYIDGADTPALQAKMTDLLGGSVASFPKPIAGEYSRGWNLYFPIPYAKSCKVTSDEGGFYYHVNYRTYAPGTEVQSFSMEQVRQLEAKIGQVAASLAAPRGEGVVPGGQNAPFDITIEPGGSNALRFDGPAAIRQIVCTVTADDRDAALRGLVARFTFDGKQTVQVPLGDFFGAAPGINAYASLPLGVTKEGEMWSHWVMPFKEWADLEVVNMGKSAVNIAGKVVTAPYTWTDRSMYFHAKWRAEFDVPTRPMVDWNYLTAKGKGVFAGVSFSIDNPVKDWWGEGDEKIYFDGEKFPSHFGTGTEDYYGYAWCSPELFTHAYHNQPRCDGPGNYGRTSVNRWHILDRIPFTSDFRFDMELWHWKECKVNMAVTAYWYGLASASDTFKPIAAADLVIRPLPEYVVPKVKGAIEGEQMKILAKTGNVGPQDWDGLSYGRHMWWHGGQKPGDTLVLGFEVAKAGRYRVMARFLKAVDYGILQLAINGQNAGQPRDFFNNGVVLTEEVELGTFDLKEGQNQISATVTGANAKAVKSYMFGLDYLRLVGE